MGVGSHDRAMKPCPDDINREGLRVCIRVAGQLDADWSPWFEGLTVTALEKGETRLRGVIADQAALHGLLSRIRDLGVPLLGLEANDDAGDSESNEASRREPESSERRCPPPSGHRPT